MKKNYFYSQMWNAYYKIVYNNPMCWKFNILYRQEFFSLLCRSVKKLVVFEMVLLGEFDPGGA